MRTLESTTPPSPLEPQSNTTGEDWGMTLVCVDILGEPWFVALQHPNFTAEMQPLLSLEKPAYRHITLARVKSLSTSRLFASHSHTITDAELSKT